MLEFQKQTRGPPSYSLEIREEQSVPAELPSAQHFEYQFLLPSVINSSVPQSFQSHLFSSSKPHETSKLSQIGALVDSCN